MSLPHWCSSLSSTVNDLGATCSASHHTLAASLLLFVHYQALCLRLQGPKVA